jgi:hypothetical protein
MLGYSSWETIAAWTIFVPVLGIGLIWPAMIVVYAFKWVVAAVRDELD